MKGRNTAMNLYPLKLTPPAKDILWGGDRLKTAYNKKSDSPRIAETWELALHKEGLSVIANGEYAGMTLADYLGIAPDENGAYDFPLLVKFIDARADLSVQVHPAKTELWYIVEADPGARLVYGLKEDFNEETFRAALAEGNLDKLLHTVEVAPGQFYMLPSGQIHAIGGGILIAEFQQNSNVTYRVWDYNRGREIHTEQAIAVMKELGVNGDFSGITECEFFKVSRQDIRGEESFAADSFVHLLCLDGAGQVDGVALEKGDSCFIPAGYGSFTVKGSLTVMLTRP